MCSVTRRVDCMYRSVRGVPSIRPSNEILSVSCRSHGWGGRLENPRHTAIDGAGRAWPQAPSETTCRARARVKTTAACVGFSSRKQGRHGVVGGVDSFLLCPVFSRDDYTLQSHPTHVPGI